MSSNNVTSYKAHLIKGTHTSQATASMVIKEQPSHNTLKDLHDVSDAKTNKEGSPTLLITGSPIAAYENARKSMPNIGNSPNRIRQNNISPNETLHKID